MKKYNPKQFKIQNPTWTPFEGDELDYLNDDSEVYDKLVALEDLRTKYSTVWQTFATKKFLYSMINAGNSEGKLTFLFDVYDLNKKEYVYP